MFRICSSYSAVPREYISDLLEGGHKFLVFAHHKGMLDAISECLTSKVSNCFAWKFSCAHPPRRLSSQFVVWISPRSLSFVPFCPPISFLFAPLLRLPTCLYFILFSFLFPMPSSFFLPISYILPTRFHGSSFSHSFLVILATITLLLIILSFSFIVSCPFFRVFVRSFFRVSVRSFVCLFVRSFVCSFVRVSVLSLVRSFVCLSVCLFVRSSVRVSVRSFVCLFVRSFVCLFVRSFVCCVRFLFVRSFLCLFVRLFVCSFGCFSFCPIEAPIHPHRWQHSSRREAVAV